MAKFTALGAHIYAGGFTLGVQAAGFKVLGHLEEWEFGVETVRKNLGLEVRTPVEKWHAEEFKGRVDFLYCNPPCASWSAAGIKVKDKETRNVKRYLHDGRTQCTELCFTLIPTVQPTVFVWESVAAAMKNGIDFVMDQAALVQKQGYHVYLVLFNGADCGLPQTRKRFFFVASKVRIDFKAPAVPRTTVRQAWRVLKGKIGEQPKTRKDLVNLLRKMPKGASGVIAKYFMKAWKGREDEMPRNPKTGHVAGRPGFLHQRIPWDGLSPTVTGGQHLYHPDEPRSLTPLEQQVLCGYPPDYEFTGGATAKYAQMAKAVLPPAGEWLARQVLAGLKKNVRIKPGVTKHDFINRITTPPSQEAA